MRTCIYPAPGLSQTSTSYARTPALHTRTLSRLQLRNQASGNASPPSTTTERTIKLKAQPISPEAFKPFGQVLGPGEDGKVYDQEDAQLVLDQGTPRFYVMRIPLRGLNFHRITYHAKVTQCLGGLSPSQPWYMAVARPSGSVQKYPQPEDLSVFRIPHGTFVKMEQGTWHAGPLFVGAEHMDFYNLELKDTNVVDHNTHDYRQHDQLQFEVVDDDLQ